MNRFFLPPESLPEGGFITVRGGDAAHIGYSLRMRRGEDITFTRDGVDYFCKIDEIGRDYVRAAVTKTENVKSEPKLRLTLFQALPKADKMELIIQKCTELGICKIVPFESERCVSKPKSPSSKTERWRKIAESAAKQSGRGIIPEVTDIVTFDAVAEEIAAYDIVLFCNENGGAKISLPDGVSKAALIVGAEGGFSSAEADAAVSAGAVSVTLGPRILRCETAPIAATAVVMYAAGEM
jgi:16S rRNA (uracil1498-N3)-methyltransferase